MFSTYVGVSYKIYVHDYLYLSNISQRIIRVKNSNIPVCHNRCLNSIRTYTQSRTGMTNRTVYVLGRYAHIGV